MEELGVDQVHGRTIRLFELSDWTWDEEASPSPPFTLLIAADASREDIPAILGFASAAIASGCRYVCTWGEDCELVHDLFDEESLESSHFVMSTWHERDPLYEAVYFALVLAVPEDAAEAAESPVVLAVADRWLPEVRRLVADQDELARLWVSEER
jgi:hypothetical protein